MHRSSESVAALAAALAKAQAELVNPEKSLTATIRTGRAGEGGDRTFRYAPLSSGLDIVRKTLGQHEIATIQSTAIDQAAGTVSLTTMLAHASGEWIASDWPVCPVSDMASPQRMGAALTYARRYALFTLVGIAGEDDLDAPDLQDCSTKLPPKPSDGVGSADPGHHGFPSEHSPGLLAGGKRGNRRSAEKRPTPVTLSVAQSTELRVRLLEEIAVISSTEAAAEWASNALAAKNRLSVGDARLIEAAFEQRLMSLGQRIDPGPAETAAAETPSHSEQAAEVIDESGSATVEGRDATSAEVVVSVNAAQIKHTSSVELGLPSDTDPPVKARARTGIDKSVLTLAEPKRYRNKAHLRFVTQQACLVCGRKPCDPHHLRFMQPRALGRKVSDEFAVPLCRVHHRAVHKVGNELTWWRAAGIDPVNIASKLWQQSRQLAEGAPVRAATNRLGPNNSDAAGASGFHEHRRPEPHRSK